jgi:CHASE2 domain-containing sensor protein
MGIRFESLGSAAKQLRGRGGWYWARVVVVSCLGLLLSRWLSDNSPRWAQGMQLPVYQVLSTSGPREAEFQHLAIVEITDEEFWKGELAGRRPVKRAYIANLVTHLCNQGAQVVALDFDLRSPLPDGSLLNHPDYKEETDTLARAIQRTPPSCKIVLARTLHCPDPPAGACTSEPSVLDSYAFDANRVSWGYINLPADARQIPLRRANVAHGTLDSFAQAIAIADSPQLAAKLRLPQDFRYGSFISLKAFEDAHAVFTAQDVLRDTSTGSADLMHKTVVVGGAWHANEYGRGLLIDSHAAPVGPVPGVFLHANYAAALLDGRAYPQASRAFSVVVDVLALALVAVIFALPASWARRWTRIAMFAVILGVVSYLFWQNLGVFLEITVPVILLLCHALVDEYLEMREELVALRQKVAAQPGRIQTRSR